MNVASIMTKKPVTIRHDQSLQDALQLMQQVGCRHLPVVSREEHLVGIISDRDCRLALNSPHVLRERWQDEVVTRDTVVAAIMSPAPIIVEPNAPAHEAARLMLTHNISALPVMRAETLVGIITTSDLLTAFMHLDKNNNGSSSTSTTEDEV